MDLARRSDDGRAGIRINAARRDGDTAVDGENQKISMSHIGVDFREENLRLSADLGFQKFSMDASMPSITFASGVPIQNTPDADKSIAQPWTYSNSEDLFGTLRAEYDFADNVTAGLAAGADHRQVVERVTLYTGPGADNVGAPHNWKNIARGL